MAKKIITVKDVDMTKLRADLKKSVGGQDGLTKEHLKYKDKALLTAFMMVYGNNEIKPYLKSTISTKKAASSKKNQKETTYKSFEEMMTDLKGVTIGEAEEMGLDKFDKEMELEEECGYAYFYACWPNAEKMDKLLKKFKLNLITECITDDEEGEDEEGHTKAVSSYSTGFHPVHWERLFLCRSKAQGFCEEKED